MIRCVKCNDVSSISKAGKVDNKQRYFCKSCNIHFTLPEKGEVSKNDSEKKQNVTIKDIAEVLQISFSTVSKALLDNPVINPDTRKKVLEMAKKMNYQPNLNAKSLVKHSSNTIGIIIPSIVSSSFYPEVLQGVQEILSEKKYNSIICLSHESYENEIANCNQLINNRVDGVLMSITSKTIETNHIKQFKEHDIPFVFVNRAPETVEASRVTVNNYEAGCKAVEHLIEQGCKNIAHIAGPPNLSFSKERLKGYYDTLIKYNYPIDQNLIVYNDLYTQNSIECITHLLDLNKKPDGIFVYSDFIGIELIIAAKERGIKVPSQLCIVGMGNNPVSSIIEPQLTTITGPTIEMGKIATELLIDEIENKTKNKTSILLDVELIVRKSTQHLESKKQR